MKHYWLVCILLLLPQAAYAATAEQANFALNLFIHACVEHMGQDTDKIAQWAKDQHIPPMDEHNATIFLHGEQGTVWNTTSKFGMFALVLAKPYKCIVLAHEADIDTLTPKFVKMMEGVTRPGVTASKIGEKDITDPKAPGQIYHQIMYFVGNDKPSGYVFLLGTNPTNPEVQARLTLSPSTKP